MRVLMESSWMKFGPAGRGSLDASPGPSVLPFTSTDRPYPDQQRSGSGEAVVQASSVLHIIVIATVSFLLLLLVALGYVACRRRRLGLGFGLGGKLSLANIIALEDLQDPERNCELLSSLRRSRGQRRLPSATSEQDAADGGVFLMVYLPSPYEQTLTRIARAASTSSSADLEPPSPGPETGSGGTTMLQEVKD